MARVGSVMDLTPFTNPGKVPDEWLKLDREWIADDVKPGKLKAGTRLARFFAKLRDCSG